MYHIKVTKINSLIWSKYVRFSPQNFKFRKKKINGSTVQMTWEFLSICKAPSKSFHTYNTFTGGRALRCFYLCLFSLLPRPNWGRISK